MERAARLLHSLRRRHRAEAKLFDAQQAVIVGVEAQARMMVGRQAQGLHGQEFQRQQHFRLVAQHKIHVGTGELDHQVRILEIGMRMHTLQDLVGHVEVHVVQNRVQELLDAGPR